MHNFFNFNAIMGLKYGDILRPTNLSFRPHDLTLILGPYMTHSFPGAGMSSEQESATVATQKIMKADGPFGLWRGLLAGLLMAPRPGLNFVFVELLQPFFRSVRGGAALTPFLNFLTGAIADCASTSAVWPLAYARIQMAVGSHLGEAGAHFLHFILKFPLICGFNVYIYIKKRNAFN